MIKYLTTSTEEKIVTLERASASEVDRLMQESENHAKNVEIIVVKLTKELEAWKADQLQNWEWRTQQAINKHSEMLSSMKVSLIEKLNGSDFQEIANACIEVESKSVPETETINTSNMGLQQENLDQLHNKLCSIFDTIRALMKAGALTTPLNTADTSVKQDDPTSGSAGLSSFQFSAPISKLEGKTETPVVSDVFGTPGVSFRNSASATAVSGGGTTSSTLNPLFRSASVASGGSAPFTIGQASFSTGQKRIYDEIETGGKRLRDSAELTSRLFHNLEDVAPGVFGRPAFGHASSGSSNALTFGGFSGASSATAAAPAFGSSIIQQQPTPTFQFGVNSGQTVPASSDNKPFAFTGAPAAAAPPAHEGFDFSIANTTPSLNFTSQHNPAGSTAPF